MPSPSSPPFPAAFVATLVGAALLGATSGGLGGALIMPGLVALVWTIIASRRRLQVLRGRGAAWGRNSVVVVGSVLALVVGSALVETDDPPAPPAAAPLVTTPATTAPGATTPDASGSTSPGTTSPTPEPSDTPDASPTVAPDDETSATPSDKPSATPDDEPDADVTTGSDPGSTLTAAGALALLEVKGRAPKTGYDRDAFRYRALDLDRNGCDTRNDILRRDLTDVTLKPGSNGCVVEQGVLADPYSALRISFTRGTATSNDVQIDHVVALSDAWQKGAQRWDADTLATFGNDPLNLLAVDGPLNGQKGDGDAATWLPPNKAFRCQYVARQIAVKHAYGLWVTAAEKTTMERILAACPDEPLPTEGTRIVVTTTGTKAPTAKPSPKPNPKPSPKPSPKPTAKPEPSTDPKFGTCKAAKSAGYGPYYAGQDDEYSWYQDRDGDGVVCE